MKRTSLWHVTGLRSLIVRVLPVLLALAVVPGSGGPVATAHAAIAAVDTIVVKIRDDALPPDASTLPVEFRDLLGEAAQVSVMQVGRTRDGAYKLSLTQSLPFVEARAAVNRVRMLPQVLYANVVDPNVGGVSPFPVLGATQPPVTKMIVKYRDQALSMLSDQGGQLGAAQLNRLSLATGQTFANERAMSGGAFVVRLFRPVLADQALALARVLESDPDIEYAEPDLRMYPTLVPNDALYTSSQWDLKTPAQSAGGANLPPAWDITTGSSGIRVAVLDTGILPHPDLIGRYSGGYDMIADSLVANDGTGRDSDPTDPGDWITSAESTQPGGWFQGCPAGNSSWHGTHVAGTIAAATNNSQGIAGINWVSQVLPVRVLGKCGGYTSDIADAMRWAAGLAVSGAPNNPTPARVISLSLGGGGTCGSTYQNAINAALTAGSVFTIAAGNGNADASGSSPGNCAGVITVAATGPTGARAYYSNYGNAVEIAGPGGDQSLGTTSGILSTLNAGATTAGAYNYVYYQGTSMATPHVAGIASLMVSANNTLTPAQVLSTIQTTARAFPTGTVRDCTSNLGSVTSTVKYCGAGIIDAGAAVAAVAVGTGPAPTTTLIASSSNPAPAGVLVTFTATVTGTAPTGNVTFRDGGVTMAGCSASALTGSGSPRTATCGISTLAVGVHSIVATYNGDAGNAASSSSPLSQTISGTAGGTSTVVTSSANPSTFGASVTFTASVTGASPTGTVMFVRGNFAITGCTAVPLTGSGSPRTAQCGTASLPLGSSLITAFYSGDAGNIASNGKMTQTVQSSTGTTTSTVVSTSGTPSTAGAGVTFTASVTGNAPTGNVGFTDNGSPIIGCTSVPLTGVSSPRTALCTTGGLTVGTHTIGGAYGGDSNNLGSNGSVTQVVLAGGPTTTTTVVTTSGTPSTAGAGVTFTASVTGNAPTGNIAFTDNGSLITGCTAVPLTGSSSPRTALCTTSGLTAGTHTIAGTYSGDAGNLSSSGSVTQVVNAGGGGTNVALASAGAVASASSTYPSGFPVAAINNNERAGVGFGSGGVWADGTGNTLPDWAQIDFGTTRTLDRVVVYSVQDNYTAPIEPTDTLTFTTRGLTAFTVQGWNGSAWVTLASVSGNNLVKRNVTFTAFATSAIRVNVTGTLGPRTYITEVEAWGF